MDIKSTGDQKRLYTLLVVLAQADPLPLTDEAMLNKMQDNYLREHVSLIEIRRMLRFLEGVGLCLIRYVGKDDIWNIDAQTKWLGSISAKGTQYLAGFGVKIDGVYRPEV